MKSKTTISRENKSYHLLKIHNNSMFLLTAKKIDLSLINSWELKEITKKMDLWVKAIFGDKKGFT